MERGSSQVPDLQSILATLASFTSPACNPVSGGIPRPDENAQATPPPQQKAEEPHPRPQGRSTAPPKSNVDPATITTWQDGLRCVTKIAAQNSHFAAAIRKMMDNQRQNEMRWYGERQALRQSQGNHERASAQADQILRGLSNSAGSPVPASTTNGNTLDTALVKFDRKIYAAQLEMDAAMTLELKGLGVPFFGTEQTAIVSDDDDQDAVQMSSSRPKHSPLISEKQLTELRKRMVEHLEALYRD